MNYNPYKLKIKLVAACFIAGILFFNQAKSQVIKDKRLFARTLALIFDHRRNGFESLRGKEIDGAYKPKMELPEAADCFISSNNVYVAQFMCPDSLAAVSFYRELKEILNQSADYYKAKVKFRNVYPENPFFEIFYFSDSLLFTNEGSSIQLMKDTPESDNTNDEEEEDSDNKTKPSPHTKKSFTVHLDISPGDAICYYTGTGARLTDKELNIFIDQVAFGKDTALKNIRINQRIQPDKILYDCKIGLKGFKTVITEIRKGKISGFNISASRKYFTDEKSFLKSVDSMVLKLKSAFPSTYCYENFIDEGSSMVEIKPAPFLNSSENEAEIQLRYSAEKNRKNEFVMELYIYRKKHN